MGHHSSNGSFAIRQGDWKLIFFPGSGGSSDPRPGRAHTQGLPHNQLYNLAGEYSEKVEALTQLMADYIDRGRSTPGENQQNEGGTPFQYQPPAPNK